MKVYNVYIGQQRLLEDDNERGLRKMEYIHIRKLAANF